MYAEDIGEGQTIFSSFHRAVSHDASDKEGAYMYSLRATRQPLMVSKQARNDQQFARVTGRSVGGEVGANRECRTRTLPKTTRLRPYL